jgi:hypothetical protein
MSMTPGTMQGARLNVMREKSKEAEGRKESILYTRAHNVHRGMVHSRVVDRRLVHRFGVKALQKYQRKPAKAHK